MRLNYFLSLLMIGSLASCSMFKKNSQQKPSSTASAGNQSAQVQSNNQNQAAFDQASQLASGWPEQSVIAAKNIIAKYGEPAETTSNQLIWRNVAPFEKIIVHRELYPHRFPLLHKNVVEHVVKYKAPSNKVDDVWNYNGAVTLDRTRGLMSVIGENEAMNILSMNLAHEILSGERDQESARVKYGQETLDYLNGQRRDYTQTLIFGNQRNTADLGESVTDKIRWVSPDGKSKSHKQAQEEK